MRLWIAIAAGLSLGQTSDVPPSPEDPSIRDPAAAALQDAYEQADEEVEGLRPPPGYVFEQPLEAGAQPYVLTPLLPDGSTPVTSGQVANQETQTQYQPYFPPSEETSSDQQTGVGGSGSTVNGDQQDAPAPQGTSTQTGQPMGGTGTTDTSVSPQGTTSGTPGTTGSAPTGMGTAGSSSSAVSGQGPAMGGSGVSSGTTPAQGTSTSDAVAPGTSPSTESTQSPATGGAGTAGASPAQGSTTGGSTVAPTGTSATGAQATGTTAQQPTTEQQLSQLRTRILELEEEMRARDAAATQRTQIVQGQVDTFQQRATEVEQARQQRLAQMQAAGQWILAADEALAVGELGVANALSIADDAFVSIRASAAQDGQGSVVVHSDRVRGQLNLAQDAAGRRDIYAARIALQNAAAELNLARAANLARSGTGNTLSSP